MRHWTTVCDAGYLPRLAALHASMARHCAPFTLYVLAWDETTAKAASALPGVEVTTLAGFLWSHADLARDQLPGPERSRVEHMWTCRSRFLADVIEETGGPAMLVDADMWFFSSPELVFEEIGAAPAAVFPHRIATAAARLPGPTRETHDQYGLYNAGMVYVRDVRIAARWAEQCRRWCLNTPAVVAGSIRYSDQSWLNELPTECGAHVVQHPGVNLGPWAIHTAKLERRDGQVWFDGQPLVAFHFSGMSAEQLTFPEYALTARQVEIVYRPYLDELASFEGLKEQG